MSCTVAIDVDGNQVVGGLLGIRKLDAKGHETSGKAGGLKTVNRSKRLNTLRHLKVAFSEQVHPCLPRPTRRRQVVQPTIFFFLLLDVFPDGGFISAYCRNIIASCPELLTPDLPVRCTQTGVPPAGHEIPGDVDRALTLHIPHHVRNSILWGDGDQHTCLCVARRQVHMIQPQMAFLHPALSLTHQLSKYLS